MDDGRRERVAELVDRHGRMVFTTAYRILGNANEAEDALQNVFLKLLGVWDEQLQAETIRDWGAYLRVMATRSAISLLRTRSVRRRETAILSPNMAASSSYDSPTPARSRQMQCPRHWFFVPIRDFLLYSLVAVNLESGRRRRITDFVGWPQIEERIGANLAIVNVDGVTIAESGNGLLSSGGTPLVDTQVMLVNLTDGEKIPVEPLKNYASQQLQLSPDRRKVAFVGARYPRDIVSFVEHCKELLLGFVEGRTLRGNVGLFVLDLETFKVKMLLSGELKTVPHWSPDSRWLAIFRSPSYQIHHKIVLVDAITGEMIETGLEGAGVRFSPDGKQLVYSAGFKPSGSFSRGVPISGNLFTASVGGGKPEQVTYLPEGGALSPTFSPDGTRLLYWQYFKERSKPNRLHEIDLGSGEDHVVTEGGRSASLRWLDSDSHVLLTFTQFLSAPSTGREEQAPEFKLIDLSSEPPTVQDFIPSANVADETAADRTLADRLVDVFATYRDAVHARDSHGIEEARAKFVEARDLARAIIDEIEAPDSGDSPPPPLHRTDLEPYLVLLERKARLSREE